jgi:hypothetical protein
MKRTAVRAYCSPMLVLLALDWADGDRHDFLGFAVERTPGMRPSLNEPQALELRIASASTDRPRTARRARRGAQASAVRGDVTVSRSRVAALSLFTLPGDPKRVLA